jgi:ABC-2 type transport system ATP-binding protein
MLRLLNVKKEYGERVILSVPDLMLTGGIYWLQGANGSGKTTLLKMIAGLIPFSGDIDLNGMNQRRNPLEYRRLVSSAEAEPAYPVFLTGRELIRFYQEIRIATTEQADRLIDQLGFGQFLSTPIGTYSSGMIKRLSLLLAFIGRAKLILLDEPLATLDGEVAILLPDLMRDYQRSFDTSFIFSSHSSLPGSEKIPIKELLVHDQSIHLNV